MNFENFKLQDCNSKTSADLFGFFLINKFSFHFTYQLKHIQSFSLESHSQRVEQWQAVNRQQSSTKHSMFDSANAAHDDLSAR